MKITAINRSILFAATLTMAIACKKTDDGELDKAGESSYDTETNRADGVPDSIPADTISGGREGINGSGIGSGAPNSTGMDEPAP